jgi:hypothetical protein
MKKILSIFCAMAIVLSVSAAPFEKKVAAQKIDVPAATRMEKVVKNVNPVQRAPKATAALESGTFYTQSGTFYINSSSGWQDATSYMPSVEVTVDGSNVTITGLAYWFEDGAIVGTMEGNTITFANGQLVGTDDYGDEFLIGSNDGQTLCDIVFTFDPEKNTLTSNTTYIMESESATEMSLYCYWISPVFSAEEPEAPEVVELPEGATVVEYVMNYTKSGSAESKFINVAVVDNDVYFQGMSAYIPEAWVKGTKEGNAVTFAAEQYMGEYGSYGSSYFFYNGETVFTYDADANTYSATGQVYGVLAGQYYDGNYTNPVLSIQEAAEPIDVVIADAEGEYNSYYSEIIYTLTSAAKDTTFVFDIKLEASQTDVELGATYTLDDMYSSVTYTYAKFGSTTVSLAKVNFVKTLSNEGLAHIEAEVTDKDLNVYNLVFDEKPIEPSGEEFDLFFDVAMAVPMYYTDINAWEFYTKSVSGDSVVAFVINSDNAESGAGTYTAADLNMEYSGIVIGENVVKIYSAAITVTETEERIDVVATVLGKDAVTYNIKMFFVTPVAAEQESLTATNLETNTNYFSSYGIVRFAASDENNAIDLTVTVPGIGAQMAGEYAAGTDFTGTITPAEGAEAEIFSGSITIAVSEEGAVTITGTVLGTNNVEYTLNLSREPQETNITIGEIASEYRSSNGDIKYTLDSEDGSYRFFFAITLPEGQEDIELNKVYTFTEDMGANTNRSYGLDRTSYNYIDYAEATFVKTIVNNAEHIEAAILDVNGDKWNLTYQGQPTAVENVEAAQKAAKRIENGQLIIRANGKDYNAQGAVIR